ncbi:hypothetical protein D9M70_345190 [compost metagenome]
MDRYSRAPNWLAWLPPPAQFTATGKRVRPMEVITVPVTSGGKKRTMRDMKGAISRPKKPAAMVAPKMPWMPTPGIPAITTMLPTAAKLAPIITGMRMPTGPSPKDCTMVAMPATSRSALIRKAISSRERPAAWPTIRGTATAPPYMRRTCWKPTSSNCIRGRRWSAGERAVSRSVGVVMQHLGRFCSCKSLGNAAPRGCGLPGIHVAAWRVMRSGGGSAGKKSPPGGRLEDTGPAWGRARRGLASWSWRPGRSSDRSGHVLPGSSG